jgi:hypothetical protein
VQTSRWRGGTGRIPQGRTPSSERQVILAACGARSVERLDLRGGLPVIPVRNPRYTTAGASRKKALSGFRATSDTGFRLSKKHECDR